MWYRKYLKEICAGTLALIIVGGSILFLHDYNRDKVKVTMLDYDIKESNSIIDGRLNINTADADMLELLDQIGEKTAAAIIEYREKNGDFKSVDELLDIKGIGENTLDEIRDTVCVGE